MILKKIRSYRFSSNKFEFKRPSALQDFYKTLSDFIFLAILRLGDE